MIKLIKNSCAWALSIISMAFTFIPEAAFEKYKLLVNFSDETNVILNRVLCFVVVFVLTIIVKAICWWRRRKVCIKGKNYSIQIQYGDILKMKDCKKVIPFDECFTTCVGNAPADINPTSICGQYLKENPIQDMQSLIADAQLKPARGRSKYQNKERYASGKLVPNGDYLLMSFAKLDENGLGRMSREEFLECLSVLWKEINKHYGQKNICIPILGSGVTRMDDMSLTQQELLDIIIGSYKLSTQKLKSPYKLYIVCKKRDDFSLNKLNENM